MKDRLQGALILIVMIVIPMTVSATFIVNTVQEQRIERAEKQERRDEFKASPKGLAIRAATVRFMEAKEEAQIAHEEADDRAHETWMTELREIRANN